MRATAALVLAAVLAAVPVRPAAAADSSSAARNNEGNRLYNQRRYDEALKMYTDAQAVRPDAPELHYNIGNVLYRKHEFDKAAEEYRKAQGARDPALSQAAVFNRGNALMAQQRLPEAIQAYVQALRADPADADAKRNLELALRLLRDQQQPAPQGGDEDRRQDERQESPASPQPQGGDEPPRGKERPGRMSEEEARQVLEALREQEREGIRKHARATVPDRRAPEKDW
jgi:tetratricopeptide (TPR) repeat protein